MKILIMNKIFYSLLTLLLSVSTLAYSQYYTNQYAVFDGINDYMSAPSHPELFSDTAFTFECWVYLKDSSGFNKTIFSTVNSANNSGYSLLIKGADANPGNAGRLQFNINGTNNIISQSAGNRISLNNWNHIAVNFKDGGVNVSDTLRFYINGTQVLSLNRLNEPIVNSGDSLRVGNCYLPLNYDNAFNGYIDDLRFYKTRRLALYISNDRGVPVSMEGISNTALLSASRYSALTAAWKFDGNGNDNTGFQNNLIPVNGASFYNVSFNPYTYRNQSNYYIRFNGQSWLSAPDSNATSYDTDTACTFEAYVYPDTSVGPVQTIISKGNNYKLGISNNKFFFSINSGSKVLNSLSNVALKQWTHIAATYASASGIMKIFINGIQDSSKIFTPGNIIVTNDSLFIGRSNTGEFLFGKLDEVRISRTAKSQDLIKRFLFTNIDINNGSQFTPAVNSYGFEGNTLDNVTRNKPLLIRGDAYFEWKNMNNTAGGSSQAPLIRTEVSDDGLIMYVKSLSGFSIRNNSTVRDSILTTGGVLNYAAVILSHTFMDDVDISLRSPSGVTVNLTTDKGGSLSDLCTAFSDFYDSSLNDVNAPFSMHIKPQSSFTAFAGSTSPGYWQITVTDDNAGNVDSGRVYMWGLRFGPIPGINSITSEVNFHLEQNYPNPFNPVTNLEFGISKSGFVSLKIYNILGEEVSEIVNEVLSQGNFRYAFDASALSSGIYYYKLQSGEFTDTKRMLLIK